MFYNRYAENINRWSFQKEMELCSEGDKKYFVLFGRRQPTDILENTK